MTKHTPGPWKARTAITDQGQPLVILPHDGNLVIARMCINKGETKMEANARLIAAAPELLKACKEFVFLEKTNMPKKQVKLRIERTKQIINKAEAK